MSPSSDRPSLGRDNSTTRRLARRLKAESQVCGICGQPIDPNLKSPHPLSWTMDHIVPLSMGGEVNDPDNVRAAHRFCNTSRGNGRRRSNPDPVRQSAREAALVQAHPTVTLGPDGLPVTPGDRSASW